jgi:hypothetical protein
LFFARLKRKAVFTEAFAALCAIPALVSLAPAGPGALAPEGILAAVFFILRGPLAGWFLGMDLRRKSKKTALREWAGLYRPALTAAGLALFPYGLGCFWGAIPLPAALALIPVYGAVLALPRWAEAKLPRRAFFPLPITVQRASFFPPALPVFTLALALVLVPAFMVRDKTGESGKPVFPGPGEYAEHAAFQVSFSLRPLNGAEAAYGSYETGPDGLIAGFDEYVPPMAAPPYSLPVPSEEQPESAGPGNVLSLALMIVLSVPACLQKRPHKRGIVKGRIS